VIRRLVTGLGGVILAVSLFLHWYEDTTVVQVTNEGIGTFLGGGEYTAWEAFAVIDILLALVAVTTLAPKLARVTAAIGVALVVLRLLEPPDAAFEVRTGAWLGLAGALIAWAGAVRVSRSASP
jgi:hypothetical protein